MILRFCIIALILVCSVTNLYVKQQTNRLNRILTYEEPTLIRNSYFIGCAKQSLDFKECHELADEFVNSYLEATKEANDHH